MSRDIKEFINFWVVCVIVIVLAITMVISGLFGIGYLYRNYDVWSSNMQGKSKLAYADQERQVMIAQAKSNFEAAKYNADAEIQKAKGIAQANKIIGQSLNDNPAYLTWKYYEVLENTKNQVIYVSTADNIPVTEAGRLMNNVSVKHEVINET